MIGELPAVSKMNSSRAAQSRELTATGKWMLDIGMTLPRFSLMLLSLAIVANGFTQEYGKADRENPGDAMIQEYLKREAEKLEANFLEGIKTREDWERERPRLMGEYFHMLGLSPLPEKTLRAMA